VRAIFEGVTAEELRNIKRVDIDEKNSALILSDFKIGKKRRLEVSERCIDTMLEAHRESQYKKYFTRKNMLRNVSEPLPLVSSPYVLRNATISSDENCSSSIIDQRIKRIKNLYNLKIMTSKSIIRSGELKAAKDELYGLSSLPEKEYLTKVLFPKLRKKFNRPEDYRGYYSLIKFVRIFHLYGEPEYDTGLIKTDKKEREKKEAAGFAWWKINEDRGKIGEQIVLNYIRSAWQNGEGAFHMPDRAGYDTHYATFQEEKHIEVKTISSAKYSFYLTLNELERAEVDDEYFLYLVVLDRDCREEIKVFAIKDPINTLSLPIEELIGAEWENGYIRDHAQNFLLELTSEAFNAAEVITIKNPAEFIQTVELREKFLSYTNTKVKSKESIKK
jgi:hypothetical protein